jgi:hypothetical protein
MDNPEEFGVNKPIEWFVPDNIVSKYATNITIQRTENEFIISFFEIVPPLFVGSPEYIKENLEKLENIRANCIARIIVSERRMAAFSKTMLDASNRIIPTEE